MTKPVHQFPPYLLSLIRKYRISNAVLAAVLKLDRTTVSKKLGSKRNVSFDEIRKILQHFKKVHGIEVDPSRVMKG